MTIPVTVSEHDLLGLLSIVSDHRADDPGDGLPLSLFERLMQQVPCDEISFFGLDSQQQAVWFGQGIPATGNGDMDAFWTHFWDSLPCSYPERSGDLRSVTRVSDFYSARQWHATGMYCDYLRPAGYDHEIMLCLPGGPGRTVREAPGVQPRGRRHPCLSGGGSRGGDLTPVLNLGQTRQGARP